MTRTTRMVAIALLTLLTFATGSMLAMGYFFAIVSIGIVLGLIARSRLRWLSNGRLKEASRFDPVVTLSSVTTPKHASRAA